MQSATNGCSPPTATDKRYRRIVRNERICILEILSKFHWTLAAKRAVVAMASTQVWMRRAPARLPSRSGPSVSARRHIACRPRTRTEPMTKLSDTQSVILSAAASRANRSLLPVPQSIRAKGKVLERSLGALLKRGFTHRRFTDVRGSMSVHRRIPDATPSGAEGRSLTQGRS